MQRKIIAQGLGGRTIFLPIKWVRENNLDAGDEVTLIEKGSNLVLCAQQPVEQKITIDAISDHDRSIRIQIQNAYRLGYNVITVRYSVPTQRTIIQKLAENNFIGFEIIEENKKVISLSIVADSNPASYETMLQRIFYIIAETFAEAQEMLQSNNITKKELITEYAQKVTKYDNFLRRTISTKKIFDDKTYLYWSLCGYLHLIERNLLHMAETYTSKRKINPQTLRLFTTLQTAFVELKKGYLTGKGNEIEIVSEQINKALEEQFLAYLTTCQPSERKMVYYFTELSRLLYLISYPLYGILRLEKS